MKSKSNTVANDAAWQRRTDEWVKMSHESRQRKEKEQEERKRRGSGYKRNSE